jgi:transposase
MPPAAQLYAENLALKARLGEAQTELAVLRQQLAWLKQKLFGAGQGEKLERAQLLLQIEGLEQLLAARSAPPQQISYERAAPQRGARTPPAETFARLPVHETITIEPPEVQAEPAAFEPIGEERTFEVDIVPPKLFKREIVRPKYRRRAERDQPPVLAKAPARIVPGGYASAGLVAWVLIAKYVDHLPLFRQQKLFARWGGGALIARQTMMEWVRLAAEWLQPIHRLMRAELLAGGYVQMDETPIPCQDPDVPGKTVQGWLWMISRPDGDVVFAWRMSRRHQEAAGLLHGYTGLLQSDGYEAYASFARDHDAVTPLGCWAHARRPFHEALQEAPVQAGFVLRLIGHLYHYEKTWDEAGRSGPALRAALRQSHFGLTLRLLHRTAEHLRARVLPKSLLGKACSYLLGQWDKLVAHTEHGRTRLDNNSIENAVRPTKLGCKNWLFIGHPEAGERSAIIYSLVVSCQRRGIEPHAYLKDVLTRLPAMTNRDDLSALTPAKWQPPPPT